MSHYKNRYLRSSDREDRGDTHENPRLRCLVDVQRTHRDDCPDYETHPVYDEPRYENKKALQESLVRLGYRRPELRKHLRPLLDYLG